MYKCNTLAALVAAVLLATAGAASAQTVTVQGGGASLPATLYKGAGDSILPDNFTYAVTGSGTGKAAFLQNKPDLFGTTGTVHFAGSDSVLDQSEIDVYNRDMAPTFGPLIQIPSVGTSVTIPFNKAGVSLNLSVANLCGVMSGAITDWKELDSSKSGPITVIYRNEKSGTTELLTRFLANACAAENADSSKLIGGKFTVTQEFWKQFKSLPSNFAVAGTLGSKPLYDKVYSTDGAIGYVGPDVVPKADLSNAAKIAKLRDASPNDPSVKATLDTIAPPTGSAANDPKNWVPVFTNPTGSGYPIVGYTNFVIGQCYKNTDVASAMRVYYSKHYGATLDTKIATAIGDHGFVALTDEWRKAIRERFFIPSSAAGLNNVNTCAGIGRP